MHSNESRSSALRTHQSFFRSGLRPGPRWANSRHFLLLQLFVVKQIFKITASEYLKYTRKYAILTLNNQKFSGEGAPHPTSLGAFGASILRPYRHFFLSTLSPDCRQKNDTIRYIIFTRAQMLTRWPA